MPIRVQAVIISPKPQVRFQVPKLHKQGREKIAKIAPHNDAQLFYRPFCAIKTIERDISVSSGVFPLLTRF
jgi:hypothetical protein